MHKWPTSTFLDRTPDPEKYFLSKTNFQNLDEDSIHNIVEYPNRIKYIKIQRNFKLL